MKVHRLDQTSKLGQNPAAGGRMGILKSDIPGLAPGDIIDFGPAESYSILTVTDVGDSLHYLEVSPR